MSWREHAALAKALVPAVLLAARVIRGHERAGTKPASKADGSPVTEADRASEEIILEALALVAPGVPVIAEEATSAGAAPVAAGLRFLVDPLDGTREFLKGNGEYTVNVGLVDDECPVFGIVLAPRSGRLFWTSGPGSASEVTIEVLAATAGRRLDELDARPIRTRRTDPRHLRILASRSHRPPELLAWLARFPEAEEVMIGSSMKFCLLARGEADIYPRLGTISHWDTAAGHAILLAAGGAVTTLTGAPLTYPAGGKLLNPPFIAWGDPEFARSALSA